MFTNQKILGFLLILLILGGGSYFAFNKFKEEVNTASASPSPSPSGLSFLFNTAAPSAQPNQEVANVNKGSAQGPIKTSVQPQATTRPLEKVKRLSAFPGTLSEDVRTNKAVVIQTAKGNIVIQIFN